MRVLIIIITYNSEKWIRKNLKSIGNDVDILIIDNGSKDNTLKVIEEEFPYVRLIISDTNLGFAKANNLGFEIAKKEGYDWVFLINHDAWLSSDCITEIQNVIINPIYKEYGLFSPVHLSGDEQTYDYGFVRFCDTLELERKKSEDVELSQVTEINGAFMMIRMECLRAVRGFDPLFFFYGEDTDLCIRAKRMGYKIGVITKAVAYHDRQMREPSFERKTNLEISNYLLQIKMLGRPILLNYLKTLYGSICQAIINKGEKKKIYTRVSVYLLINIKKILNSL